MRHSAKARGASERRASTESDEVVCAPVVSDRALRAGAPHLDMPAPPTPESGALAPTSRRPSSRGSPERAGVDLPARSARKSTSHPSDLLEPSPEAMAAPIPALTSRDIRLPGIPGKALAVGDPSHPHRYIWFCTLRKKSVTHRDRSRLCMQPGKIGACLRRV